MESIKTYYGEEIKIEDVIAVENTSTYERSWWQVKYKNENDTVIKRITYTTFKEVEKYLFDKSDDGKLQKKAIIFAKENINIFLNEYIDLDKLMDQYKKQAVEFYESELKIQDEFEKLKIIVTDFYNKKKIIFEHNIIALVIDEDNERVKLEMLNNNNILVPLTEYNRFKSIISDRVLICKRQL